MSKIKIAMDNVSDVSQFVAHAGKLDGEVTCTSGRYIINGKSIMGMFSIDITKGFEVEYPSDATEFGEFLIKFAV